MASKLRKTSDQPGITGFFSFSDNETTNSRNNKKRTPPSLEKNISKKLYFENQSTKDTMSFNNKNTIRKNNDDSDMDTDRESSDSEKEEELGSCSTEQIVFERRLIKSMEKLMKKQLKSVKSDLKKLNNRQKNQEKHIEEIETIKEENKLLRTACDIALRENREPEG